MVSITSPAAGAQVPALVRVFATVSQGVEPMTVRMSVLGGPVQATLARPPYVANLDLSDVAENAVTLLAEVTDANGRRAQARVAVTVDPTRDQGDMPPRVRLVYPLQGGDVCGSLEVQASAGDDKGVTAVRFYLDGTLVNTLTAPPYRWLWDSSKAKAGAHSLAAEALDTAGRSALDSIQVQVAAAAGKPCDNLPSVVLVSPESNAVVQGEVLLAAEASDDVGVERVQFFVDGSMLVDDASVPHQAIWDSDLFSEGLHLIRALARDTAGQTGKAEVSVTVDRTPPTVRFIAPMDGARVSGTTNVVVEPMDANGVAAVALSVFRAGALVAELGTVTKAPFERKWDTSSLAAGSYELRATAWDRVGLRTTVALRVALGLAMGQTCTRATQCESGYCADGVCCDTNCAGTCYSCALAGSPGICAPLKNADDPGVCDGTRTCNVSGRCVKKGGQTCALSSDCVSGFCVDGVCCDGACTGPCQSCSQSGSVGTCSPVISASDPGTCSGASSCDSEGRCIGALGTTCTGASVCASGFCVDGVCCDSACTGACMACNKTGLAGRCTAVSLNVEDPGCVAPNVCDGAGNCRKAKAQACAASAECASGYCVDGVCCSAACNGSCMTCNAPTSVGTCAQVRSAPDPDSCDGLCSATGFCAAKLGIACTSGGGCSSGYCVDGVCCEGSCSGTCRACNVPGQLGACAVVAANDDVGTCSGTRTCSATGVCAARAGQTCTDGATCASGFCVDGVCCDTTCAGTCMACNVTGKSGTCSATAVGTTDAACSATQACDGVGACKKAKGQACTAGSECASGACPAGTCCADANCTPSYAWSAVFSGTSTSAASGTLSVAAIDSNTVVMGHFLVNSDLDIGSGVDLRTTSATSTFVTRLGVQQQTIWARVLGSTGLVGGRAVVVAGSSIYVTGLFSGTADFDPGPGSANHTAVGTYDGFIVKLDGDGNLVWARVLPGGSTSSIVTPTGLSVGSDGSLAIIGTLSGTADLDPGPGVDSRSSSNGTGFIVKLNAAGEWQWSRQVSTPAAFVYQSSSVYDVSLTADGSVIYGGGFTGTVDLDPTAGQDARTAVAGGDAFITKLASDGSYAWSRTAGGPGSEAATAMALADGTILMVGSYTSAGVVFQGQNQSLVQSNNGMFLVHYASDGSHLGTRIVAGTSTSRVVPRRVFRAGTGALVAGYFSGTVDFDPGAGLLSKTNTVAGTSGGQEFVARYTADGDVLWVIPILGAGEASVPSAAFLADGGLAVGDTMVGSADMDPGPASDVKGVASQQAGWISHYTP
jgi:hypothetical protein